MNLSFLPSWGEALSWGFISGLALVLGALIGYYFPLRQQIIGAIMSFGAGVLISVICFELLPESLNHGLMVTCGGFILGGLVYSTLNYLISKRGATHRKRSSKLQHSEEEKEGSGLALAVGALLDGIPESLILGAGLMSGGQVSIVTLMGIMISNLPEGLSSSVGMKMSGRSKFYIFGVWGSIAMISAVCSLIGYSFALKISPEVLALLVAIGSGAMLTMISETMIPEASEGSYPFTGVITLIGFLFSLVIGKMNP